MDGFQKTKKKPLGGLCYACLMATAIAILLRPLFALIFLACIVLPIKLLLKRVIPDGKVKKFLFTDFGKKPHRPGYH